MQIKLIFISRTFVSRCCLAGIKCISLNSSLRLFGLLLCSHIRECLKLDQDDKDCFSHYKQVKKLSKQLDAAEELIQMERLVLLKDWCSFYTQIMILLTHLQPRSS